MSDAGRLASLTSLVDHLERAVDLADVIEDHLLAALITEALECASGLMSGREQN